MTIKTYNKFLIALGLSLLIVLSGLINIPDLEAAARLESVDILQSPAGIAINVSQKIPDKIIRIGSAELLIALKNINTSKGLAIKGPSGSIIKEVHAENAPGNVVAVIVTGTSAFGLVTPEWKDNQLIIRLEPSPAAPKSQADKVSESRQKDTDPNSLKEQSKTIANLETQPVETKNQETPSETESVAYIPPLRPKSIYSGEISDLIIMAEASDCASKPFNSAILFLKNKMFPKALDELDASIRTQGPPCLEFASFLKGFALTKLGGTDDYRLLIQATRAFEDALIAFPESKLIPFALSGLGIIQVHMKNPAAAEGYFNLVKNEYPDYPGIPEVYYYLAQIYTSQGYIDKSQEYLDKAADYYKAVFEEFPLNTYTLKAGLGHGKALYRKKHYILADSILSYIIESSPEFIYESPEVLLSIGNANLQLSRSERARSYLTRVCNLFPEIETKDMIMTSIGDTYALEKNYERAMAVYQLVIDTFPGGEGFLESSMGLARYLKNREAREKIYTMIKTDYPEHRLASVAMMRLAEIYNQTGEYARCIKELEDLLAKYPRGLRYEAVKLMQQAYESLFDQSLKSGDYPEILKRYEGEHVLIDRMESKRLLLQIGLAYLKAHLYEQSFNQLIKAYKLFKLPERPPQLLFGLGVAMSETSRYDDGLKMLSGFVKRFPSHPDAAEALLIIGNIHLSEERLSDALKTYTAAYKTSSNHLQKGDIQMKMAQVHNRRQDWLQSAITFSRAADDFASAPGTNYDRISQAYRGLGESYLEQTFYIKAAESFETALKFSETPEEKASLSFMLGDAYQKGNALEKAIETFDKVADSDDSIWARLARERLSTLELAEKVKNS